MSKKAHRKTYRPEMPLWRVVVASEAWRGYEVTYYIAKFPLKNRELAIIGVLEHFHQMYPGKCFVKEQG